MDKPRLSFWQIWNMSFGFLGIQFGWGLQHVHASAADLLPEEQRTRRFGMQSLFIGLGAVVASALHWLMTNAFHVGIGSGGPGTIPVNVKLSFYVGAAAFLGAVLWTILTT